MPKTSIPATAEGLPAMNRRWFLTSAPVAAKTALEGPGLRYQQTRSSAEEPRRSMPVRQAHDGTPGPA